MAQAGDGDNPGVVRRLLEEALSTSNLDLLDQLLAPTCRFHGCGGPPLDREATRRALAHLFTAFPDLWITVEELGGAGAMVVARYTVHGTQRGTFHGLAPTGRTLAVTGIGRYRVEGGHIAEVWAGLDLMGWRHQLDEHP